MGPQRTCVVIVDGIGSAGALAEVCRRRRLTSLLLWSRAEAADRWSRTRTAVYDQVRVHRGSLEETAGLLRPLGVACVIGAQPASLAFAAALAERLGVAANALSPDRPGPGPPAQAAGRLAGDPSASPPAAGEGVQPGLRYVLNSVNCRGRSWFTDVWREDPPGRWEAGSGGRIRVLLASGEPPLAQLMPLAAAALLRRGIVHGPAQSRLIMTEAGPVVERCDPCFDAIADPDLHAACLGPDPFELTLDALLNPADFERKTAGPYPLRRHARLVELAPACPGIVRAVPGVAWLTALSTCLYLVCACRAGERSPSGSAGHVALAGPDPVLLDRDCAAIRAAEREGRFFEIAAQPTGPSVPREAEPVPLLGKLRASLPGDESRRREFLGRIDYYQSPAYAATMSSRGWEIVWVADAAVFIRPLPSGVFAKMQRPVRLDPGGLAHLWESAGIAEFVVEPAARATLIEGGRETCLEFDPAAPGPWLDLLRAAGFTPGPRRYAPSKSLVAPLDGGPDDVLARFSAKRRREVRRALEAPLDYACVAFPHLTGADRRALARMHADWSGERNLRGHDQPFLDAVVEAFADSGFCVLARAGDALAGAFFVLVHDAVAHYYYTFTDPHFDRLRVSVGGIATAMRHARAGGCVFFDLGAGRDERYPEENLSWAGFSFFKEQFRPFPVYHPPSLRFSG